MARHRAAENICDPFAFLRVVSPHKRIADERDCRLATLLRLDVTKADAVVMDLNCARTGVGLHRIWNWEPAKFGIVRVYRLDAALIEPQIAQVDDAQHHLGSSQRDDKNHNLDRHPAQPASLPACRYPRGHCPQFRAARLSRSMR